ncbi:MAG: hypothetical protein RIS47_2318 [Bacteroidota bacterium]|jgi:hypothetical protein
MKDAEYRKIAFRNVMKKRVEDGLPSENARIDFSKNREALVEAEIARLKASEKEQNPKDNERE